MDKTKSRPTFFLVQESIGLEYTLQHGRKERNFHLEISIEKILLISHKKKYLIALFRTAVFPQERNYTNPSL